MRTVHVRPSGLHPIYRYLCFFSWGHGGHVPNYYKIAPNLLPELFINRSDLSLLTNGGLHS